MTLQDKLQKMNSSNEMSEETLIKIWELVVDEIQPYKSKAEKWDTLGSKIERCYVTVDGDELTEEESENIDLGYIGEISARAFGWL